MTTNLNLFYLKQLSTENNGLGLIARLQNFDALLHTAHRRNFSFTLGRAGKMFTRKNRGGSAPTP